MNLPVLTAAQVKAAAASPEQADVLTAGGFLDRTPLWYYLLAEAKHHGGNRLGPVGSNLVAEVLIGFARVAGGGASTKIYKVKRGDDLPGIAKAQLGDAKRWPEIQRLNRDVVPNPNTLAVGLDLVVVRD